MDRLPTIPGRGLRLRELGASDAAGVRAVFGDPEVLRTMPVRPRTTDAEALEMIEGLRGLAARDELYQWGIALDPGDEVIGTVTLASIELEHRRAEIGFALAREHRGQGHASAAVQLVLGHAFEAMALHRIEADVDPRNGPSIALLERVGFRREGLQLQRWLLHGEWQDALLFGLLAPWWRQLRGRAG
ncbi:MAG: GNAT family N-acetyltransferase [Myxococcales bacterium]|nr:GNAT family N-acetyltransferase [Myxococcales bacterium]